MRRGENITRQKAERSDYEHESHVRKSPRSCGLCSRDCVYRWSGKHSACTDPNHLLHVWDGLDCR